MLFYLISKSCAYKYTFAYICVFVYKCTNVGITKIATHFFLRFKKILRSFKELKVFPLVSTTKII